MRVARAWEKRHHGGPKPTWRPAPSTIVRGTGEPLARSVRTETNRTVKKLRLEFC